jgi:hypothetical protein
VPSSTTQSEKIAWFGESNKLKTWVAAILLGPKSFSFAPFFAMSEFPDEIDTRKSQSGVFVTFKSRARNFGVSNPLLSTFIMIGTPVLNAAQMVQAQVLRDRLTQEMAVRNQNNPDDASNASRLDGSSPEDPLTGIVRSRDDADDDEFPSRLANPTAPYNLEEGRAFKRHKNLSGQSDNDAEIFLKARLLSSVSIRLPDNHSRRVTRCATCTRCIS